MTDRGDSDARAAILARRARLIGLALVGSTTVGATACVCLSPPPYDYDAPQDGGTDAPEDTRAPMDVPSSAGDAPTDVSPDAAEDGGGDAP